VRDDEHQHQTALFNWARLAEPAHPELRWLHSTQGGARVSPRVAARLKAEGMKAGPPDLFLDVPRPPYAGLRIELKRPGSKGKPKGRVTDTQAEWLDHYQQAGFAAIACWGWEQAAQTIVRYLKGEPIT
jgi:hypothetical protein